MTEPSINPEMMPANTRQVFVSMANHRFIARYTLVGGTALALQTGHRLSEDLDFMSDDEELNGITIKRNIAKLFPGYRIIRQELPWQIDFVINNVKVTFFSAGAIAVPFQVSRYSFKHKGINICFVKTIASLKMAAIAQRNTIRDYYDLYYITRYHIPLKEVIDQTKQLIPGLSPVTYTGTLIYTADIEENSIASHLAPAELVTKEQIATFFTAELRKIKNEI
jgi:hypothetical protein